MKTIALSTLQAQVRDRKAAFEMTDSPSATEALRNKGAARTAMKRELLRRTEQRAVVAGLEPILSYY